MPTSNLHNITHGSSTHRLAAGDLATGRELVMQAIHKTRAKLGVAPTIEQVRADLWWHAPALSRRLWPWLYALREEGRIISIHPIVVRR